MKQPSSAANRSPALRAKSKAPWKQPQPYLTHRPGWRGRLLRLRARLAA